MGRSTESKVKANLTRKGVGKAKAEKVAKKFVANARRKRKGK